MQSALLSPGTCASAQAPQPSFPALLPPPQPAGGLAHTNLAEWTPATRLPAASPPALTKGSSPMGPGVRVCPLPRRPGEAQVERPLHVSGRAWNVSGWSAQPGAWHI